jgi:hypothetical protein
MLSWLVLVRIINALYNSSSTRPKEADRVLDLPKYKALIAGALAAGIALSGAHTAAAATVKASTKCSNIIQTATESKRNCKTTFTNGPRVKFQFARKGNTVELRACAYGHRPRGYEFIDIERVLNTAGGAVAQKLALHGSCFLGGEKPFDTIDVSPGDRVTVRATLYWSGNNISNGAYLDILA